MGINSGKFYDAKLTRSYCDAMKQSVNNYLKSAATVHSAYDAFDKNIYFHGITAKSLKSFITGGVGKMLTEVTDIHKQMVTDQTYMITTFETSVDSAQNARIEFDTLDTIDKDFVGYYKSYVPIAKDVKQIVTNLNNEFGEYAHFEQPDSQTGKNAFERICSAEGHDSGFLKACQKKLVNFDSTVKGYLKGRDTMEHVSNLTTRYDNTESEIAGFTGEGTLQKAASSVSKVTYHAIHASVNSKAGALNNSGPNKSAVK